MVFLQRHRAGKDEFDMELAVALRATKHAIDHLVQRRCFSDDGRSNSIVLVGSIADLYVAPEQSLGYHIGKAGLSQLARYYALELGPMGIRVNTVSPCVVAKDEAREFYDKNEWLADRFRKFIPLGRMGKPQDIVNAIMFLASEQASYITGQNIVVDGGLTLRSHESLLRDFPREE
jgi:NAD(P)-dependent dehydrogenase (short-subunit alcohol dehydrogenase family)